jgi:glycosyltransferase involved in cell wall biosynthesis
MIAFHTPPMLGSSGMQRTLKFSRQLPQLGWTPIVLTARPLAYRARGEGQMAELAQVDVHRSLSLDVARHLAVSGRYPAWLAWPDCWNSWWLSAVPAGLRLIRRYRPDIIWSTYPIATAQLIALSLHRLSGIPWVADLRDPMSEDNYPPQPRLRRIHRWIEDRMQRHAACTVCTTPGALRAYRARYPWRDERHFSLIENGYDEENFTAGAASSPAATASRTGVFLLLHSGLVYPSERDPGALFAALSALLKEGRLSSANFLLRLRATGHDDYLRQLARRHAVDAIVELAPALPYDAALAEMLACDALLLLQAANCNQQIPAKLYEYLRAARPVLALTDARGDSAAKLRQCGIDTIFPLDSADAIRAALPRFLQAARNGTAPLPTASVIEGESRRARAAQLAALFDRIGSEATALPGRMICKESI